jgi:serine/threonine protein kinase
MDEEAKSKLPMTFTARYKMGDILGKGAFSTVRLATSKISNKKWAVKAVARKGLPQEDEDALRSEVAILRKLPYRHIVYCKVRARMQYIEGW